MKTWFNSTRSLRICFLGILCLASVNCCLLWGENTNSTVALAKDKGATEDGGWIPLFDNKSLKGWKINEFGGHGEIKVDPEFKPNTTNAVDKADTGPAIVIEMGESLSGIRWTNEPVRNNYEISLEGMRIDGNDFFCGLTFPVGTNHCTYILGGWGGTVVGLSSVNGYDASENETTKMISFDRNRWYQIRLRVTDKKIEGWIDSDKVINLLLEDKKITIRYGEIGQSIPLGICTWQTSAAIRNIKVRKI